MDFLLTHPELVHLKRVDSACHVSKLELHRGPREQRHHVIVAKLHFHYPGRHCRFHFTFSVLYLSLSLCSYAHDNDLGCIW